MKRAREVEKRRQWGSRFLATVVAQIAGNKDTNFLEDDEPTERKLLPLDVTEPFFAALAERTKR